jgi:hypothetical protein
MVIILAFGNAAGRLDDGSEKSAAEANSVRMS